MGSHCRARRGSRALVAGTITTVALSGVSAAPASAATPTNIQRAQQAAQYLANQIELHGGVLHNFGKADPIDTAYAVVGMRAAGVDKAASNLATNYLKEHIGKEIQAGGKDSPGAIAEYILAAKANGQDARRFGGTGAKNNLVARLLATSRTKGANKGLFGVQSPSFDGAFRQGLALVALHAVGVAASDARVRAGITWLTKQQCANGLWQAYRASTTTACPPANPNTFTGPDTNSTALAVQGLAVWGKFPRATSVLPSLRSIQSDDGGFPYIAATGQASDPNSTALVIQTILAERHSPNSSIWSKGLGTPYTALASYQLGCTSPEFGAFFFPGSTSGNIFATVQSVPAMAGKRLPVASSTASVIVPLTPC